MAEQRLDQCAVDVRGDEPGDQTLRVVLRRRVGARLRQRQRAHRRVDAPGHEVRLGERARDRPPRAEQIVRPAHRPERDAGLVDVLEHAWNGERLVERVVRVEQRDGVGLAPRDRLSADPQEERSLGEVEVGLVDAKRNLAVAAEDGIVLVRILLPGIDQLVGMGDRRRLRVSLRDATLERSHRAGILPGAVLVDAVVEAPEREAEGEVVQLPRPGLVPGQLGVELRLHEVAVLDDLERRAFRLRLRLGDLRGHGGLAVGAHPEIEVAVHVEVEGARGSRERQRDEQDPRDDGDAMRRPRHAPLECIIEWRGESEKASSLSCLSSLAANGGVIPRRASTGTSPERGNCRRGTSPVRGKIRRDAKVGRKMLARAIHRRLLERAPRSCSVHRRAVRPEGMPR